MIRSKLDESFPSMQFRIEGYNFFRSDLNANGVGILVYVRNGILCKLIQIPKSSIKGILIELNIRKKK